jgi:hypothetical protein
MKMKTRRLSASLLFALAGAAHADPSLVEHAPTGGVYNVSGATQRNPAIPREDDGVDLYFRVSFQFSYDRVAIYYTTDGSDPQGSFGSPVGTTQVLLGGGSNTGAQFQFNESTPGGTRDWWKGTLPASARQYSQTIKYKISAWQSFSGPELFHDGTTSSGAAASFTYANKLAWPGAGAGQANPSAGYPPVNFWKEEAFIGNTYTAAMLDQNGTYWDMYFPTPGGVQGVGTKNEGYSDGPDTFPSLLSSEKRGQMHLNQAQLGIRVNGLTHWLSNPNGVSYNNIQQSYLTNDTNTVSTSETLYASGANINVQQTDFAPAGIAFPNGSGPQRHILIKRVTLTNATASAQTANVYFYMDPALNGGNDYDAMFWDASRGAMTVYDKTKRTVAGTGAFITPPEEYNITTFSGYTKNIALYLSASMKTLSAPGASGGALASDAWSDTSSDQGQGWIGQKVTLPPNTPVEIDIAMVGAYFRPDDPVNGTIPVADGVYDNQIAPALSWFTSNSMQSIQAATDSYWSNWLASGTTVSFPDARYDKLFKRGLLATALHQDGVKGGIVAGFHNGAYYFVWPRDAMWATITLARAGHIDEAKNAITWMRETTYRDPEPGFGTNPYTGQTYKGFWKQKYTTDGYVVWGAPQVDETAVFPWAVKYVYDITGDASFLSLNYPTVRESVLSMTQDSIDSRLFFIDPPGTGPGTQNLMYSNNVWEDSYAPFVMSNANIVRGLRDAAAISTVLGNSGDASDEANRASTIKSGLDDRLAWDGENTDISMLGVVYPFEVYTPTDARAVQIIDRINGVKTKFNNSAGSAEPLVNFAGFPNDDYGWTNLINRYTGDGYWAASPWGAGPWFLSTMWYGCYYASRQDFTTGKSDIDNHKMRLDLLIDRLGPMGLGAEQLAPRAVAGDPSRPGSLMYANQNDFMLEAAWPNAWESMSFFADSIMRFLDYVPDAASNTMTFKPKLPSAWNTLTFRGVTLVNTPSGHTHHVDTTISETLGSVTQTLTNTTGFPLNFKTRLRVPANQGVCVTINGAAVNPSARDASLGMVEVSGVMTSGANAVTTVQVRYAINANCDGSTGTPVLSASDFTCFLSKFRAGDPYANCDGSTGSPTLTASDFTCFLAAFRSGCQ